MFEFAGSFLCEGFKARKKNKHRDRFSFSNADFEQIDRFVNATEALLDISKTEWNMQILFPDDDYIINILKNYWARTGTKRENISVVKNNKISATFEICILNIYNSTLAETMQHVFDHLYQESYKTEEAAKYFFRGLSR